MMRLDHFKVLLHQNFESAKY